MYLYTLYSLFNSILFNIIYINMNTNNRDFLYLHTLHIT